LARKNLSVAINNSNRGSDTSSSCNKYIVQHESNDAGKIREKDAENLSKFVVEIRNKADDPPILGGTRDGSIQRKV